MRITKTWFKKEIDITPNELQEFYERVDNSVQERTNTWVIVEILKFIKSCND